MKIVTCERPLGERLLLALCLMALVGMVVVPVAGFAAYVASRLTGPSLGGSVIAMLVGAAGSAAAILLRARRTG